MSAATITLCRWTITDPATGRRMATCYRMTEREARRRYPDAVRVPGSELTRLVRPVASGGPPASHGALRVRAGTARQDLPG